MGSSPSRSAGIRSALSALLAGVASLGLGGCASPGLPRPPSLQLPALADDLAATRQGGAVDLQFTLPSRTTDHLTLKSPTVTAKLCRAVDAGPCQPLVKTKSFPSPVAGASPITVLRDVLPVDLVSGPAHLLTYRIDLANSRGRSAGFSEPAFAASGAAPRAVAALAAEGSRLGAVLTWTGESQPGDQVMLRREHVGPVAPSPLATQPAPAYSFATAAPPVQTPANKTRPAAGAKVRYQGGRRSSSSSTATEPGVFWLDAHAEGEAAGGHGNATLDTTAATDVTYRYTAERRRTVQASGKTLEIRSETSAPVTFTLRDVFPPQAPTELSAAGFVTPASGNIPEAFAVDLIWQPVDDQHLAGYNVYRQQLDAAGAAEGAKTKLNAKLLTAPAFHDADALPQRRYRYLVTAVDSKGNESPGAATTLDSR